MKSLKLKDILLEDWWDNLSAGEQSDYIKKHPKSKKAVDSEKDDVKVDVPIHKMNFKDFTKKFIPKFDFSKTKKSEYSNGYVKADKPIPSIPTEKLSYKLDTSPIKTEEDFQNWKSSYMDSGDLIENMNGYAAEVQESHMNYRKGLSKPETKQLEKDINFWKMKGGYDAYTYADDDEKRQVVKRNERLSSMAHESVVKIKQPLERGISVPKEVTEQILSMYKVGEDAEIPGKDSHGCSGFSLSGKVARKFSGANNLDSTIDSDNDSILFRILPNSNSEVRGLFIDGDPTDGVNDGFLEEMEILRSPKSKLKVKSIQKKKGPNGNTLTIIEFQEPDSFNESIMNENKKDTDSVSLKYLSGPVNQQRTKEKGTKKIKLSDLIKKKKN